MRRLFIPFGALLALAACDSATSTDPALVGSWTLTSITTASGEAVEAPVGSTLTFGRGGALSLDSGNDCSGEYEVRGGTLVLDFDLCTEIGTDATSDLAVVFGFWEHAPPVIPTVNYAIGESLPLKLVLSYETPEADLRLRFRADG